MEVQELLKDIKEDEERAVGSYGASQGTDILALDHAERMGKLHSDIKEFMGEGNMDLPF